MKPLEAGEEGRRWETPEEPGVKKDRRGSGFGKASRRGAGAKRGGPQAGLPAVTALLLPS